MASTEGVTKEIDFVVPKRARPYNKELVEKLKEFSLNIEHFTHFSGHSGRRE